MHKIVLLVLAVFCYGNALSDGPKEVEMDEETPKTPDTLDTVSQSKAKKYPVFRDLKQEIETLIETKSKAKKYPAAFRDPPEETVMGISFVPYKGAETDYERAKNMALRQLALSKRVRVRGKESLDEGLTDLIGLRWEKFVSKEWKVFQREHELLEVPSVALDACVVETLIVDNLAWVSVQLRNEERHSWGQWGYFRPDSLADLYPQSWDDSLVNHDDDWLYGIGMAAVSFKDEADSWERAMYRALFELAEQVSLRVASISMFNTNTFIQTFDTRLQGFRVAARWRDDKHLYVLVRVPRSGAVSLLKDP